MIKLLAVDMDGTCLDPFSRFSSQNLAALYRAKAAGIEIVPTTGRALDCLPHVLKAHPDLFR
ncbi:HAD family hydrolase, partial [uncultured Dubosiella sp.]